MRQRVTHCTRGAVREALDERQSARGIAREALCVAARSAAIEEACSEVGEPLRSAVHEGVCSSAIDAAPLIQ